ncbi:MAG TPA: multifunctional CCA addition/repair protein [Woeseiaceae bacterium]|nr:multifunctional CCA addition/repair protein [Woeseiaceae bacterium]
MEVYLVGGAVRDELLGLPVRERDWCVVGATPETLIELGYRQVGKDFPVFLHPQSGEEYALARTERKTGAGYHGFCFETSPNVSIEEDLGRRDLTINAIARDSNGRIIDPYNGVADIAARLLRHVSDAFSEDPVRVLRVARFAARFAGLGFRVAPETLQKMRDVVAAGEVRELVPDRVWKETQAALAGANPQVFFEVLRDCGALKVVFPEVDALFGIPQPAKWHPEIDCGVHAMMVLEQASLISDSGEVRFAALVHDLGKATTPKAKLPSHPGHEKRSVRLVNALAGRMPVPAAYRELGVLVAEFHAHCHRAFELRASTLLRVLQRVDAFRRPDRFEKFLLACEADARGRTGFENAPYPQAQYFRGAFEATAAISGAEFAGEELDGGEIGERVSQARVAALRQYRTALAQVPKK